MEAAESARIQAENEAESQRIQAEIEAIQHEISTQQKIISKGEENQTLLEKVQSQITLLENATFSEINHAKLEQLQS